MEKDDQETFKPSEFMRNRRPSYYSDSEIIQESSLTEDYLRYHLENITEKKQEYLFEEFAKALAEKEICPNLISQTGPLGGGDSKRDTETYAVSEKISDHWFAPVPKEAKEDHWAFAISASKKWKQKVKRDVKKIVKEVDREFKRIFFISSRSISDKKKGDIQDELEKKFDIELQIFDANWIAEKVFKNSREELVYEYLDVNLPHKEKKKIGPKDSVRLNRFKKLKKKISDESNYENRKYVLVEDFLRAGKLARSLEKSQVETLGFLDQAITIAKRTSITNQIIRSLYDKAWTCYWWYNDIESTWEMYEELEEYTIDSMSYNDIKLLSNLFVVLYASHRDGLLDVDSSKITKKKNALFKSLKQLANNPSKPNNAINAATQIEVMKLALWPEDEDQVKEALVELNSILNKDENYLQHAVDPVIELFYDIGSAFEKYDEYDDLFETICELSQEREGEIKKGELLLKRGVQNIEIQEPFKAIRLLEKARKFLSKEEAFRGFINCSVAISVAYRKLELFWAARKELLAALNHFDSNFRKEGNIVYQHVRCSQELIWCEILLGRVPQALTWFEYSLIVSKTIDKEILNENDFSEIFERQDVLLSLLISKSSIRQLKSLEDLILTLDEFGLHASSNSLMYSLGDYNELKDAYEDKELDPNKDIDETFAYSMLRPEYSLLPPKPIYHLRRKVDYNTKILGSNIKFELKNTKNLVAFSEDLLGSVEAFFSTIGLKDMILAYPNLTIKLRESDLTSYPGKMDDLSKGKIGVLVNSNLFDFVDPSAQKKYRDFLLDIIVKILTYSISREREEHMKKVEELSKEGAFSRSLNISPSYIFLNNILGEEIRYRISDWLMSDDDTIYELKRERRWVHDLDEKIVEEVRSKKEDLKGQRESIEYDKAKHKNIIRLNELVVDEYWEKAGWEGMFYNVLKHPEVDELPELGFVFSDKKGAFDIFKDLQEKVGQHDSEDEIRISLVEDINESKDYIVIFSCHPEAILERKGIDYDLKNFFIMSKRIKIVHSENHEAKEVFKEVVRELGAYKIVPVIIREGKPAIGKDLTIKKHKIEFVNASDAEEGTLEHTILKDFRDGKFG